MHLKDRWILVGQSIALLGLVAYLAYGVARSEWWLLLTAYVACFAVYLTCIVGRRTDAYAPYYLALGLALRLVTLFSVPNLSDDFYRFLWDGHLWHQGTHPFLYTPAQWVAAHGLPSEGFEAVLYAGMNSRPFHTVYPPVHQGLFWLAAWPHQLWAGVFVLKIGLLASECVALWYLYRHFRPTAAVWYALNPLIVLEIVNNAHFEGMAITGLIVGGHYLTQHRVGAAALGWVVAICAKLLPLLFLPIGWRILGTRRFMVFCLAVGVGCALLFWPLLSATVLANMATSLRLYFREFEFNASVYYIVKTIANAQAGYNVGRFIGPMLSGITVLSVLLLSLRKSTSPAAFWTAMTLAATFYLLNASTVHPWYITVPFALSLSTPLRWPLLAWTGTAVFSYSHYVGGGFQEWFGWIWLEYAIVALVGCICFKKMTTNT